MQSNEFYGLVQQQSHADTTQRAQAASEAVLETLGEALTAGEAENVAAQLPDDLAAVLDEADHDGAGYDRDAFLDRVGEHLRGRDADVDPGDAERYVDAVTDAVATALTEGELQDLKAQLDADLGLFFEHVDVDRDAV